MSLYAADYLTGLCKGSVRLDQDCPARGPQSSMVCNAQILNIFRMNKLNQIISYPSASFIHKFTSLSHSENLSIFSVIVGCLVGWFVSQSVSQSVSGLNSCGLV